MVNMYTLIQSCWNLLFIRSKIKIITSIPILILSALTESASISVLVPLLTNIDKGGKENSVVNPFLQYMDVENMVLAFTFLLLMSVVLRWLTITIVHKISFEIGAELSSKLFLNYISSDIKKTDSQNVSNLLSALSTKSGVIIFQLVAPCLHIFSSITSLSMIAFALLYFYPQYLLYFSATIVVVLYLAKLTVSQFLEKNGLTISKNESLKLQIIQDVVAHKREIIANDLSKTYNHKFNKNELSLRMAQCSNAILSLSPRYALEFIIYFSIGSLVLFFQINKTPLVSLIPIIGAFLFGAQRALPVVQSLFSNWASLKGGVPSIADIVNLLNDLNSRTAMQAAVIRIPFQSLKLREVGIKFNNKDYILRNLNLSIKKGDRVILSGPSGSGKSSLADLISGFIEEFEGELFLNNLNITESPSTLLSCSSFSSQDGKIVNGSIQDNVVFGREYSEKSYEKVIKVTAIDEFANKEQCESIYFVGERGSRLSGGQRQRIALARTLYGSKDLVVLDEVTSALDRKTETVVIRNLLKEFDEKTFIFISHNPKELSKLDQKFKIITLSKDI